MEIDSNWVKLMGSVLIGARLWRSCKNCCQLKQQSPDSGYPGKQDALSWLNRFENGIFCRCHHFCTFFSSFHRKDSRSKWVSSRVGRSRVDHRGNRSCDVYR